MLADVLRFPPVIDAPEMCKRRSRSFGSVGLDERIDDDVKRETELVVVDEVACIRPRDGIGRHEVIQQRERGSELALEVVPEVR